VPVRDARRVSDSAHPLLPNTIPLLDAVPGSVRVGGVDSADGLRVESDDGWVRGLLRGLDGRRSQRAVLADAAATGLDPGAVRALLEALRRSGLLVDLDPADLLAADAGPAAGARTRVELPGTAAGGRARWLTRRTAVVVVDGATRVGVPLAAVLAASGVGRVSVRDAGLATADDAAVGGLTAADEGRPRTLAAADAVRRANPLTDLRPLPSGTPADVVVLTRPWAASDPLVAGIHRSGAAHLVATVRGETGVVGPFVLPGVTSCLRCADLHRRDADPQWPALAAQLTARTPPPAGATVTCLLTAGTAAVQVLSYLDGQAAPAALGATLEVRPPTFETRRRPWPVHPECGCTAPSCGGTTVPSGVPGSSQDRMGS
jgi:bacteriocin biosynthesis cyclodehydratase domain-containing protein